MRQLRGDAARGLGHQGQARTTPAGLDASQPPPLNPATKTDAALLPTCRLHLPARGGWKPGSVDRLGAKYAAGRQHHWAQNGTGGSGGVISSTTAFQAPPLGTGGRLKASLRCSSFSSSSLNLRG